MAAMSEDAVSRLPTPYADVNAAVSRFLSDIRTIFGRGFAGMYLSGSLALGDFSADRSDIDFLVATESEVSGEELEALREMHARFNASDSPWATEVEAAYISRFALRRYDPARATHPHIERGPGEILDLDSLASDWILQRHIVREHGVVVAGPSPCELIDPVPPDDMRRAVVGLMDAWWGPMRYDAGPLSRRGYQAYTVLTMCRILYTFERGDVVSKPVAARWALQLLGGRWYALIDRALAWRKDDPDDASADVDVTRDMIQYVLERCIWSP
jgi:Domain of unknown function (DUF4111)/Nucleotidyltransferase domain